MAATDITAPLARMKTLVGAIPNIGLVYDYDLFSRTNLAPFLVSQIAGVQTLRAWWFSGPTMIGQPMVQTAAGYIERVWRYTIYGIEGLTEGGDSLLTLRANALAVSDAIDAEPDLNGTCHRTRPTTWVVNENRAAWAGIGASFAQLTKEIVTLSTP